MKTGQAPQEYSPGDVVVFLLRKERRTLILTTGELRALPPSDAPAPSECTRLRDGGDTSTSWVAAGVCARPALPHSLAATAGGTAGPVGHTASLISERTDNQHSTNLDFYPMRPIRRLVRGPWLALASSPALQFSFSAALPSCLVCGAPSVPVLKL